MKTIECKYLGPTNFRGSRIKATDGDHSITVDYDHGARREDAWDGAARAFVDMMGWLPNGGRMHRGDTKSGMVYVFEGYGDSSTLEFKPSPERHATERKRLSDIMVRNGLKATE